ncbi:hypothetical protein BaRGS_00005010, partial [Batillaria attramentaria]
PLPISRSNRPATSTARQSPCLVNGQDQGKQPLSFPKRALGRCLGGEGASPSPARPAEMKASSSRECGVGEWAPSEDKDDETSCTFVLHDEDHTLGNSLRYIIMKNPEVEFCGYSVPHPSENKINLRIQTRGPPAVEVLKKGLRDLNDVCSHVLSTFQAAVQDYKGGFKADTEMDTTS